MATLERAREWCKAQMYDNIGPPRSLRGTRQGRTGGDGRSPLDWGSAACLGNARRGRLLWAGERRVNR